MNNYLNILYFQAINTDCFNRMPGFPTFPLQYSIINWAQNQKLLSGNIKMFMKAILNF